MDVFARAGMRAWLVGAATAGIMTPVFIWGQTASPTNPTSPPGETPALVVESEIEQQLRMLYERDGREMPNFKLTPSPAAKQVAPTPSPASAAARTPAPPVRPRYSAAPPSQPAKPTNKVTAFFKKLIPGGNKPTQAQSAPRPPRQLPPTPPQTVNVPQPQPAYGQPRALPQQAAATAAPQYAPPSAPTAVPVPPSPTQPVSTESLKELVSEPEASFIPVPAPAVADEPSPQDDDDLNLDDDDEMFEAPMQVETTPVEAAPPRLDDDFPNPFQESPEMEPALEEVANPYTGRSLDDNDDEDAPADLPPPADIKPVTSSSDPTVDESTAAKMRRIIQRADMKGLKGFCPVTLRDERELADSRPEFVATFRGQKFYFASKDAQARFEDDPARYAPAAYGADVVVLVRDQDVVEGSLDHAAWYKGRLYLFANQETHDVFVKHPERYATPPGVE